MSWQTYGAFAHVWLMWPKWGWWHTPWKFNMAFGHMKHMFLLKESTLFQGDQGFYQAVQPALAEVAMHSDIKQLDKKLSKARLARSGWSWMWECFEMVWSGHIGGWAVSYKFFQEVIFEYYLNCNPCCVQKLKKAERFLLESILFPFLKFAEKF